MQSIDTQLEEIRTEIRRALWNPNTYFTLTADDTEAGRRVVEFMEFEDTQRSLPYRLQDNGYLPALRTRIPEVERYIQAASELKAKIGPDRVERITSCWIPVGNVKMPTCWREHEEDMASLSAAFPDVLLTVRGEGREGDEPNGKVWVKRFRGGRRNSL